MSRRFHPGNVHLAELGDVMQYVAKLLLEALFFLARKFETRETRDVVDVEFFRSGHGYLRIV